MDDTWRFIQTASGRKFYPLHPNPDDIDINDIAISLSNQCRYTGHMWNGFYSIAQHSVHVSMICDQKDVLIALLHDASEAFISDVSRPVKYMKEMAPYREIEEDIMRAICDKFGLPHEIPGSVHVADKVMLSTEARDLMHPPGQTQEEWDEIWGKWAKDYPPLPEPMFTLPPGVARDWFLARFEQLTMKRPVLV